MLFVLAGALVFFRPVFAADHYVSPDGSASWASSTNILAPSSWQTAMANAVAGDTVYFRDGIYEPGEGNQFSDPKMHPANDGTSGNPITLKGYPGETAVIHDAPYTGHVAPENNTRPAAGCHQNSYVTWDGFTFERDKDNGYQASAIIRFELSDHCAVTNSDLIGRSHFDYANGALIHIVQSSYISIYNNKLHGMSRDPNAIESTVNTTAIWSFDFDHVYIYNNDFYDNYSHVNTKIGTNYLYVYNNYIRNCGHTAFVNWWQLENATDEIIYNNVIKDCPFVFDATDAGNYNQYNFKLYNNTIYNSGIGQLITIGHINYHGRRGTEVFNNIIYNAGGGNPLLVRYYNSPDPLEMPEYADYNAYYGGGYWNLNYNDQYNYNTLTAWSAATNLDTYSITADPQFVNAGGASAADYKLQAGSPARIGRGGAYASVMGAYVSGDETIGYTAPVLIDQTPPVLAQITAVATPATDTTPDYVFSSSEAGTITYGGDCASATTNANPGNNTITFNALAVGTHSNCHITVTDTSGNPSLALSVAPFSIEAVNPPASGGSSAGSPGGGGVSSGTSQVVNQATSTATSTISMTNTATTTATSTAATNSAQASSSPATEQNVVDEAGYVYDRNQFVNLNEINRLLYSKINSLGKVSLSDQAKRALALFIQEGTASTKILGAGERAGAVGSYFAAFGTLPKDKASWIDVIKIGNGRWPKQTSAKAEAAAEKIFKTIYLRAPKRKENKYDNNAVSVIAYGLRPAKRNLNSEKAAIKSFKFIFKRTPNKSNDWDIVRAVAYSGAKR